MVKKKKSLYPPATRILVALLSTDKRVLGQASHLPFLTLIVGGTLSLVTICSLTPVPPSILSVFIHSRTSYLRLYGQFSPISLLPPSVRCLKACLPSPTEPSERLQDLLKLGWYNHIFSSCNSLNQTHQLLRLPLRNAGPGFFSVTIAALYLGTGHSVCYSSFRVQTTLRPGGLKQWQCHFLSLVLQ